MVPLNDVSLCQFCIHCINDARFVLNLYRVRLSPYPTHGPVNFVSPFALSGPWPEVRRRSSGHLPRCSRGARTTREEPGPGAGTGSAGQLPGWSHQTAGPRERAVSQGSSHVRNKHVSPGWGREALWSPSHHQYADLRPREQHSLPSKWLKLCPSFWATHSMQPILMRNEFISSVGEALFFSLSTILKDQPCKRQTGSCPRSWAWRWPTTAICLWTIRRCPGTVSHSLDLPLSGWDSGQLYSGSSLLPRIHSHRCMSSIHKRLWEDSLEPLRGNNKRQIDSREWRV